MVSIQVPTLDTEFKEKLLNRSAKGVRLAIKILDEVADGSQIPGFKLTTGLLIKTCDAIEVCQLFRPSQPITHALIGFP